MEKLYTVKEVAEILKYTDRRIREFIKLGKIKVIRIGVNGTSIRITEKELLRLRGEYESGE